jgi:hypothetical protein
MNPFISYFSQEFSEGYKPEKIIHPVITFAEAEYTLSAKVRSLDIALFDLEDVILHAEKKGLRNFFQGLIGERLLACVLQELVDSTLEKEKPGYGRVLIETQKQRGKGYVVSFNDNYMLRFHSKTSLVLLEKSPQHPEHWYAEEKLGLRACEIDGLGYVHFNGDKYLLVGEVKTSDSWISMFEPTFADDIERKVAKPLHSLFPEHHIIFLYVAHKDVIFTADGFLRKKTAVAHQELNKRGIDVIFASIPDTPKPIETYAEELEKITPLVRKLIT